MGNLVSRVRRWWRPRARRPAAAPYEVACACGQVARGTRQARHQVVRCGSCRQPVFVLPASPLPHWSTADVPAPSGVAPSLAARRSPQRFWLWPLVAGAATLAVAAICIVSLLWYLRPPHQAAAPARVEDVAAVVDAGRNDLAAGKFRLAAGQLQRAVALLEQQPERQGGPRAREVSQLRRQAALLADLLTEPLGGILQSAATQHDEEWEAQFAENYLTRSVVFDAEVSRNGAGQLRLDFHVRAGAEPARIDVNDLKLLAKLPRDRPPRLLFGARLASIAREPPGVWVVRFDPDSGVLLTDPGAAAAACPGPADDELTDLLRRQKQWLDELP
jgi:hypothetical protein